MAQIPTMSTGLAERFDRIPAPVQGALYMTGAALGFALINVLVRTASAELDPLQIAFFRNLFALAFMMPWLMRVGLSGLTTRRPVLHLGRAALGLAAMITWFTALSLLPLAEAVALNFTVPLFATAGAAVILGEVVRRRRWTATIVGFLGVLVIMRPGAAAFSPAAALPILAALFMAGSALMVKTLSRTDNPGAVVFIMNLLLTPLSLVPALFVWRWPGWEVWAAAVGIGLFAALAHVSLARAYVKADASAVMPFHYAQLPLVALLGYLLFAEVPDLWTWVGAAIIAGSAIYIARREAQIARERRSETAASRSPEARL